MQILKGASQPERDLWLLDNFTAADFHYTNQSDCRDVADIDDKSDYEHLRKALACAGVSKEDQLSLLGVVAALLHLGNVSFVACRKENTDAADISEQGRESLKKFCLLTECEPAILEKALLSRTMVAG
jgi:myosin-5